ncbi:hypothetical protein GGS23DRAFT_82537 [Durotheca rogersii]|uniref:uncharacterized protein n=1 Tax=Durotheca rogersii TaxID=419775 RepID=UPI00221F8F76|nr:uncharacterized protein GGS23DRAFT_82537 [Durotheca rogersii]KAI5862574.1 hypothetical protein GGS23DRAFT_82537 [Durotheca rogersii]
MDHSSDHSTLTTIGGWAVLLGLGVALWYSSQQKQKKATDRYGSAPKQSGKQASTDSVGDAKKTEKPTKPKPKAPTSPTSEAFTSSVEYNREEDEAAGRKADREFARQLSNVHTGTKFNNKKSDEKKQKSIKQSKAQELPDEKKASAPSSHADDADDDLSPQISPVVGAADEHGVADMLEPLPSGPTVLRLTDVDAKKPKERKQKAPEVVETKKQRQNRKKVEAAKAAREEDEKERKVKMEQQRRTARIAEGRAAKDGSSFMANTENAWNGNKKASSDSKDVVQPLDTFEQQRNVKPVKQNTSNGATTAKDKKSDEWVAGIPSEEEQMEMIRQEDSWSEVKTKKKGKKKEAPGETSAPSVPATNGTGGAPAAKASVPVNGTNKKPITSNSSFAALTPEETEDNEEVEQEWDV